VAVAADRLGYREVWVGEGPTWDSFVLAAAIGRATERVALTAGPVAVSVREPFGIARGAAVRARVAEYAEAGLDETPSSPRRPAIRAGSGRRRRSGEPGDGAQAGLMLWLNRKTLSGS
jgi:hypothetical protein